MKIIDSHTHFYPAFAASAPEDWAARAGEAYWRSLAGKRPDGKKSLQGFPSEKKFLEDMDAAGVERAIIQGWYWENSSTCGLMNAEISKFAKRHPDRISAFASVCPADIDSAIETAKTARENGFCGLGEIHDGVQKFSYASEEFASFAAAAAVEALPICAHLTERGERRYLGKCCTQNFDAINAARKFPQLNFIFAHWCGGEVFENECVLEGLGNAYFDSAASPLMYDESAWAKGNAEVLRKRAVFGSDYPIRLYPRKFKEEELAEIVSEAKMHSPKAAQEDFFYNNIQTLISL